MASWDDLGESGSGGGDDWDASSGSGSDTKDNWDDSSSDENKGEGASGAAGKSTVPDPSKTQGKKGKKGGKKGKKGGKKKKLKELGVVALPDFNPREDGDGMGVGTGEHDGFGFVDESEKIRRRELEEAADLAHTMDTFAGFAEPAAPVETVQVEVQVEVGVGPDSIDMMTPSSLLDFNDFAGRVATKMAEFDDSPHYTICLEKFLREATDGMEVADIRTLSRTLNAIANEKQKEKKKGAKKAKKKAKNQLNRGGGNKGQGKSVFDDMGDMGDFDEFDDFM